MKTIYVIVAACLLANPLLAQTNYTANASGPGTLNTFVGLNAGIHTTNGFGNVFTGCSAGYDNTTGNQAGYQNTSGLSNTFFGGNAGRNISTGSHNTIIGNKAGPAPVNTDDKSTWATTRVPTTRAVRIP